MKRIIFKSLALVIAVSASEAGAQVQSRHVSFSSYMTENQKILSHRRRPMLQVAFQDSGPARAIASEPGGGIQLPSINSANPQAAPPSETPKGFSTPVPMQSAAPLAQPPKAPAQLPIPTIPPAPPAGNPTGNLPADFPPNLIPPGMTPPGGGN